MQCPKARIFQSVTSVGNRIGGGLGYGYAYGMSQGDAPLALGCLLGPRWLERVENRKWIVEEHLRTITSTNSAAEHQ